MMARQMDASLGRQTAEYWAPKKVDKMDVKSAGRKVLPMELR